MHARGLTTLPDLTSLKILLLGEVNRRDRKDGVDQVAIVQLDFAHVLPRKCGESNFKKWHARSMGAQCLMGHKVSKFNALGIRCSTMS